MENELEPQILVRYKSSSAQLGFTIMLALAPFWLLWIPWVSSWVFTAIYRDLLNGHVEPALIVLLVFFLGLLLTSLATVFVCRQNRFLVSGAGIDFPLRCLLELSWRLHRPWSDLSSIEFVGPDKKHSNNPTAMIFKFVNDVLPLELAAFTKDDLQKLLMAVEAYRPNLSIEPPLPKLNLGISAASALPGSGPGTSFTKIWEDDLANRFGSTVFVPLEPGDKLQNGTLQVVGQIAFGGLSAIYLVKRKSGDLCVIKEAVIPSSADEASREKAMEMFAREAQLLMTLKHPRIARVLDNFVENTRHYLLLEHIEGRDLRRFVKEHGAQKEEMVLRWAREALEVVLHLHELQPPIVHRDLTPDNLVLEKDGSVTLIDFGAANEFLGTATGTLVGKQSYIPPEQFRGKAVPQSDLYSLGATLHFLLTGHDPEPLSQSHPRELQPSVSQECDSFVAKLTEMDLSERFATAADALQECKKLLSGRKNGASVRLVDDVAQKS
ncbi:MAG: serine/threonine protein kinase [Candidatus Obscuribacterales bacterium]|nr:serine/threonine protein kinase [Candidatus Obscuribacterales bacterium]